MTDVGDLLASDPSIRSPGAALFRDGKLIAAARIKFPIDTTRNVAERSIIAADAIAAWALEQGAHPNALAFEWPQIYASDTPARANAVVTMASVNCALATGLIVAAAMRGKALQVLSYVPAEVWGQVMKHKTGSAKASPRGKRILSRLDAAELQLVPDQHDALDAVGIGLHALGRLGIRHVNSNGHDGR